MKRLVTALALVLTMAIFTGCTNIDIDKLINEQKAAIDAALKEPLRTQVLNLTDGVVGKPEDGPATLEKVCVNGGAKWAYMKGSGLLAKVPLGAVDLQKQIAGFCDRREKLTLMEVWEAIGLYDRLVYTLAADAAIQIGTAIIGAGFGLPIK
jgi:hypothetical protein